MERGTVSWPSGEGWRTGNRVRGGELEKLKTEGETGVEGGVARRRRETHAATRLRRAWRRLRGPATFVEAGLLAATAALAVVWLEIPDETGWGKVLAVGVAVCWAVLFLWAQSAVLILMRRGNLMRVSAWKGAVLLAGLGLLFWMVATFFDAGALQDAERAERWVTHTWVWHVASAATLERAEAAGWWLLRVLVAGALLPFGMEGAARGLRGGWLGAGMRPLRQVAYWLAMIGMAAIGTAVTHGLLGPRTRLPVVMEVLLVVLTTGLVFVVDVGGLCAMLALAATYLKDGERAEVPEAVPLRSRRRRARSVVSH